MEKEPQNVPQQNEGVSKNIEDSLVLSSTQEAMTFYEEVKDRLLNVNSWDQLAGTLSATFQLVDAKGNEIEGSAKVGDYFKIDLPGPGTIAGEGFDWVQVESIEETEKQVEADASITMRVRPCSSPIDNDDNSIAHFLSDSATSNFVVVRKGNTVTAAVLGRNEKPNTQANSIIDKTRNTVVAASAIAGVANLQWNALVKGLLGK
jgi:hypothetical protein